MTFLLSKVRLQPGLRKLGQPPSPRAGNSSHYAVICLPAVTTSCKVSHYFRSLTLELNRTAAHTVVPRADAGRRRSPVAVLMPARDSRAAARLSGPLRSAACERAGGRHRGPWPGPQPVGREPLEKPPLSLASQRGEPRYAKSRSKKTSQATPRALGGDAAPEAGR